MWSCNFFVVIILSITISDLIHAIVVVASFHMSGRTFEHYGRRSKCVIYSSQNLQTGTLSALNYKKTGYIRKFIFLLKYNSVALTISHYIEHESPILSITITITMASHCAEKCNDEPKFDDEQDEMYDYA